MKKDTRYYLGWGARLRLVGRLLGLTGLLAAAIGLFLWLAVGRDLAVDNLKAAFQDPAGSGAAAAVWLMTGAALAAFVILIELLSWLAGSAPVGRRPG